MTCNDTGETATRISENKSLALMVDGNIPAFLDIQLNIPSQE